MCFSILDARTQAEAWQETLQRAGCADVYFTPGYALSFNEVEEGDPLLFVFEDRRGIFLYPFRERELAAQPGLEAFAGHRDIISTYGYGGPLIFVPRLEERRALVGSALDAFDEFCRTRGVISEFCRFHPLLGNADDVRERYDPILLNQTVWVDLDRSEQDVLSDMRPNYRRDVRKALKNGLVVRHGRDFDLIKSFHDLYTKSMRDVGASRRYFFDQEFFSNLVQVHVETSALYIVYRENDPLAGTLYIWGGSDAHNHFSGMDRTRGESHASKLAHYSAIMDCHRRGIKRIHLGGGYGGSDTDSLMCFKSGFSPLRASYHIGRRIHDKAVFLKACEAVGAPPHSTAFFPAYRAPAVGLDGCAARPAPGSRPARAGWGEA